MAGTEEDDGVTDGLNHVGEVPLFTVDDFDLVGAVRKLLKERAPDVYAEYMRLVALPAASGSSDGG